MAPLANKITLDPKLLVSKGLDVSNFKSQEDPRVLAQIKKSVTKNPATSTLIKPVIPAVIKTPQQLMKPMSVEPLPEKQEMPKNIRNNLIAGNVSPQSLKGDPFSDLYSDFKKGMPVSEVANLYPEYKGVDQKVLEQLSIDIKNGMPSSEIARLYPELTQPQQDQSILGQIKQGAKDVGGGLLTSIMKTGELATRPIQYAGEQLGKGIDYLAGTNYQETSPFKIAGATREQLPQVAQDVTGGRPSSLGFKGGELAGDIATSSVATAAGAGLAGSALGGTTVATQAANIASKYPRLAAATKLAAQGATDTQAYNLQSEGKAANIGEMGAGAGINVALGGLGALASKGLKSAAEKLQLSGLLNPSDLKKTAKAMQLSPKDIGSVSDWMLEKNMVGSKEKILSKVEDFAAKNYDETQRALASSTTTHKVPEAKQALIKLKNAFGGDRADPGLEDLFKEVNDLYKKSNKGLTLSELNKVQQLQGKYLPNFTKSLEVKDTLGAEANSRLYNKVKTYIEDAASSEGIGNIRKLKKDTQIANLIKGGIASKEAADFARQLMSPFAGGAAGSFLGGASPTDDPVTWLRNVIVGAAVGKTLASKTLQSRAAKAIYNMGDKGPIGDISRRTITQFINQLYNNDK